MRSMHEVTHVLGDLVADDTGRVWRRIRAAYFDDAAVLYADGEATGIGTIEGTDARAFVDAHGDLLPYLSRWSQKLVPRH